MEETPSVPGQLRVAEFPARVVVVGSVLNVEGKVREGQTLASNSIRRDAPGVAELRAA